MWDTIESFAEIQENDIRLAPQLKSMRPIMCGRYELGSGGEFLSEPVLLV